MTAVCIWIVRRRNVEEYVGGCSSYSVPIGWCCGLQWPTYAAVL